MAVWRDQKIADLARQLTYSPADKRAEQLRAAADLVPQISPHIDYPWEFVLYRLTGYRPKELVEHAVPGEALRADLAQLVEFLSETLSQRVDESGGVLTLSEVTRQFAVSSKTIQRWRRQGLLAQRYVFPDGRRRLGFLKSAVDAFASTNAERVDKSARFRQLSDEEKQQIIRWARRLSAYCHCCMKDISRRIARKLGRSPETIRYTIRRYDREHPDTAIFPDVAEPIRNTDRQVILDYFDRGMPVDCIAKRYCRTRSSIYRVVSQERAEKLKALRIDFIPNPLFELPDAEQILLQELPAEAHSRAQEAAPQADALAGVPRDLPAYLAAVFGQPAMAPELELDAFRRMNYLKYRAVERQKALDPSQATSSDLAEIESLLARAATIKNQLVQANLRVAVHVARKHQRPGMDLMELVSDATIWLMRAVERFDFARGVKFATYASYAIMKNFARERVDQIARRDKHLVTGQEELLAQAGGRESSGVAEQVDALSQQTDLVSLIQQLPARERELLKAHYGLDQTQPAQSLAQLGQKLGITKSRVRQLETRALRKLRRLLEQQREQGEKTAEQDPIQPLND